MKISWKVMQLLFHLKNLVMMKTLFMIDEGLVGCKDHSADTTTIGESVGKMFWLNVISQISCHFAIVLITDSTSLATHTTFWYELIEIF